MEKLLSIIQTLFTKDWMCGIACILLLFFANWWYSYDLKLLRKGRPLNHLISAMIIFLAIMWAFSYAYYKPSEPHRLLTYYAWILVWPRPIAWATFTVERTPYHLLKLYGWSAKKAREGFPLFHIVYDRTLWSVAYFFSLNFHTPHFTGFCEANRILKKFEKSGDSEILYYFHTTRKKYEISVRYFGTSEQELKKLTKKPVVTKRKVFS